MRCHICNSVLKEPQFNRDHDDYDPCEPCLIVINDTLASWTDKPYADEEVWEEEVEIDWTSHVDGFI